MTEQYQCKSYSDDNRVVQDCTCGKCGNTPDTELEDNITSAISSNPALRDKILALVSSRDTYWKERVGNVLDDVEEHASQQDSDEEIGGMLRAVEMIRNNLNINANR